MKRTPPRLPMMRKEGLVTDDLPDEVLVYDLDRHKAHCLNRTAALVWRQCDGRTAAPQIARRLTAELDQPFTGEMVSLALRQLDKTHLLQESVSLPSAQGGLSRREMVRTIGIATAAAMPVITSIVAPTPVQAATCKPAGATCATDAECCSKNCLGNHTCHA
jgi:hypothetical protein